MSERSIRRAREREAVRDNRRARRIGKRAAIVTGAGLGATVLFAPAAEAATFTVTSLADDGSEGTLRKEIADAVAADGDDTIAFQSGLTGTIQLAGGGDADIEITGDSLAIQGPGADQLTIRGAGTDRIFEVIDADAADDEAVFSGLTITNGNGIASAKSGGAISSEIDAGAFALDIVVDNSVLTGNQADKGGALYSFYAAIAVRNSVISNNQADEHGGAIYLYYANQDGSEPQSLLVSNSTISSNVAGTGGGGYDGGAIFSDQPAGATLIENTTISGNSADDDAGGVKVYSDDPTLGGGGGPITVSNSTISNNRSDDYAGGFAFYGGEIGNETISGVTVSGNRAAGGGGGGSFWGIGGDLLVENSTFSGNVADTDGDGTGYGGGFHSYNNADLPTPEVDTNRTIRNSTIVDNSAEDGGGIYAYLADAPGGPGDVLRLSSTIVANNTATEAGEGADLGENDPAGGPTGSFDLGFSLIENPEAGAQIVESPAGSNITGADPQLGPLANNGGPTQTHLPALGSPVIDAGVANGLGNDQRGFPRTADLAAVANRTGADGTDIGSVEVRGANCQGKVALAEFSSTGGNDTIIGTEGSDSISGAAGNDTIDGVGGKDCLKGDDGKDKLRGGGGKDSESGGAGKDKVKGQGGKDTLKGNGGKDSLNGGEGRDKLVGGAGKDKMRGAAAKDALKGGGGKDKINTVDAKRDTVNCGGGKGDRATVDEIDKVKGNCEVVREVNKS